MRLTIKTPAKVNLLLKVDGVRTDDYHEVLTILHMISLYDELTFTPLEGDIKIVYNIEGISMPEGIPKIENLLGPPEDNLAFRAVKLLKEKTNVSAGVSIEIRKGIPVSAGLGGGSSDAAATLIALNYLWKTELSRHELMEISRDLGTDVPFFIFGPAAIGRGRGDKLMPFKPLPGLNLIVVNPAFPVSTAWVYKNFKTKTIIRNKRPDGQGEPPIRGTYWIKKGYPKKVADFLGRIRKGDFVRGTGSSLRIMSKRQRLTDKDYNVKMFGFKKFNKLENDLEDVVVARYPLIKQLKKELIDNGALTAMMSGSGPTVFGIYPDDATANKVKEKMQRKGYWVEAVKTLESSPFEEYL